MDATAKLSWSPPHPPRHQKSQVARDRCRALSTRESTPAMYIELIRAWAHVDFRRGMEGLDAPASANVLYHLVHTCRLSLPITAPGKRLCSESHNEQLGPASGPGTVTFYMKERGRVSLILRPVLFARKQGHRHNDCGRQINAYMCTASAVAHKSFHSL